MKNKAWVLHIFLLFGIFYGISFVLVGFRPLVALVVTIEAIALCCVVGKIVGR